MEDSQNAAPGSVQANKLGGAKKSVEPAQNAAKRCDMYILDGPALSPLEAD
jgi:hypothetical protein